MKSHVGWLSLLWIALSPSAIAGPNEDAIEAVKGGDLVAAANIVRPSAERGDSSAQRILGAIYLQRRDYTAALGWFSRSAKQGDAGAEYDLGVMYDDGLGVQKNSSEAANWFLRAANRGMMDAQYNIAYDYEHGMGVSRNDGLAAHWYEAAAHNGSPEAMYFLGKMNEEGRGTSVDPVKAHMFYNLAAYYQSEPKYRDQALRRRAELESRMTPEQIAESYRQGKAWPVARRAEQTLP